MKLNKQVASILLVVGLLIGGLVAGIVIAGQPAGASAAPSSQTSDPCVEDDDTMEAEETKDLDDVQEEVECGPQDENEADEVEEADEAEGSEAEEHDGAEETVPADWTGITADEAWAIVQAANPGTSSVATEFEQEGGVAVYEFELDNGSEVSVDATTGEIVGTEAGD